MCTLTLLVLSCRSSNVKTVINSALLSNLVKIGEEGFKKFHFFPSQFIKKNTRTALCIFSQCENSHLLPNREVKYN